MATKSRKRRIPSLRFTKSRKIGWYASYRHPVTGQPTRKRFGNIAQAEAVAAYNKWLPNHLSGESTTKQATGDVELQRYERRDRPAPAVVIVPGSLLHVANDLVHLWESTSRESDQDARAAGTIDKAVATDRTKQIHDFLASVNDKHGQGAVGRMKLADLTMDDVESYNRSIVKAKYSQSQVQKRLWVVKTLIDRAGRPEHGHQVLAWNWDSRDVFHGEPAKERALPSLPLLKRILSACDARGRAMIWIAIGLGFGQKDLADLHVRDIDAKSYDMRRSKTDMERYGDTPPMVWAAVTEYLKKHRREPTQLLFETRDGHPLTHDRVNAVLQWWTKLRTRLNETKLTMSGFYTLRHVGATEFGSREKCSISEMRRWLGHGASSQMADRYMRPVKPEYREMVLWVREALATGKASLRSKQPANASGKV